MDYNGDHNLLERIRAGDKNAFQEIFHKFYRKLRVYAYTFVKENEDAEEIVQQVFCRIWERRDQLRPEGSLQSLLYRSVYNESLSQLRHQKVRNTFQVHQTKQMENTDRDASHQLIASELNRQIQHAIAKLPEQCRTIFQMSRFEQLKYQQIADALNISIKTVENQMGKALKVMRIKLIEFLPLIVILLHLIS
ncbi:RNA polymerase sigma-70 factor (ECF subfamily) [Pedobacter africanus]|uniref:RNA polymerase sigma-70 factor (ECF subfamily) n=1 Tax=Pedobacter africanus TaxID=151894 RepID=A0ACC6KV09_9SPHI|nr:RNA polymerase sigma-70 factor [Pedobacter africanus]MDR6782985.1 RNA polymerase sigma-70 factor (ECF subfamily) [Pedobacter africanus]